MSVRSISTTENLIIETKNDTKHLVEIRTYLGTTIFKDKIAPLNNRIEIKGLDPGKYIIHISNENNLIKKQINI